MRESTVEKSINTFAKENGILTLKLSGTNASGQPDRLYLKDGKALFLEVKAPGKRPSPLQRWWLGRLHGAGFAADWCDNAADGKRILAATLL
jgi:hypothetical protein